MDIVTEEWRPLPGKWSHLNYEVSNLGRIRSLYTGRAMSQRVDSHGYCCVSLSEEGHGSRTIVVHPLVARAFVGPRENGNWVNHKNGVKSDNRADNLEWVTPGENVRHAWNTGLCEQNRESSKAMKMTRTKRGDLINGRRLFDDATVVEIREKRKQGAGISVLAREYGCGAPTMYQLLAGNTYKNVTA